MESLGVVEPEDEASVAIAITSDGSTITGFSSWSQPGSASEPFLWTSGGGMIGLGDINGGGEQALAYDVDDSGTIVVGRVTDDDGDGFAASWTNGVGWELISLVKNSTGRGVSADGSIFVGTELNKAARWAAVGPQFVLDDLPGGCDESTAIGVSADGNVIIGTCRASSQTRAVRWVGSVPEEIHVPTSDARGVSADEYVIAGNANGDGYVWYGDVGTMQLRFLIKAFGFPVPDTTTLIVQGLSDDGTTVVGYTLDEFFDSEPFRAVIPMALPVPEPQSGLMLWSGLAALLAMSRHRESRRRRNTP